jgi:hypothetical protein
MAGSSGRQRPLKQQCAAGLFGRKEGERDLRDEPLFPAEAGPKGGVDNGLDGSDIGQGCQTPVAIGANFGPLPRKVCVDLRRDSSGGRVSGLAFHV